MLSLPPIILLGVLACEPLVDAWHIATARVRLAIFHARRLA